MPIFARRRIQTMLDELAPALGPHKGKDFLGRLGLDRQPDQVIAAEMELALLWGIKRVANLEIEPTTSTGRLPDCFSRDFFGSTPALIEITTVSDASFSGEKLMRRAFTKIGDFANTVLRGASRELTLHFAERSYWEKGRYRRVRCVNSKFELTEEMRQALVAWLRGSKTEKLRLKNDDIDVAIGWQAGRKVRTARFWSTMPPIAYDLEDNPLFGALTSSRKRKQLKEAPNDALRCIFVADGGCHLLRHIESRDPTNRECNGLAIIRHAMTKAKLDVVCALSPKRQTDFMRPLMGGPIAWTVTLVVSPRAANIDTSRLTALADILPRPRFEGYQARSLQERAAFMPGGRGWYLGTTTHWHTKNGKDEVMLRISARALQEYLAGKLTREQFERRWNNEDNLFDHFLKRGYTLSAMKLERTGLDEDDDHVVFEFTKDAAASEFHFPFRGDPTMPKNSRRHE